jgi:hypothetical protein
MREEIFGQTRPVVAYNELSDAIACVNAHPRPLALYVFSDHKATIDHALAHTTSGNVTINDTLLHCVMDDLPFGGIGASDRGAWIRPLKDRTDRMRKQEEYDPCPEIVLFLVLRSRYWPCNAVVGIPLPRSSV